MKARFADTFFYVALLDRRDQHHRALAAHLAANDDFLITTRWVMAEVANTLGGTSNRQRAAGWLTFVEQDPDKMIVKSSDDLCLKGLRLYADRPDKVWSLTDCISFVVMKEHDLSEALTGDHHFDQAGFRAFFAM